MTSLLHIRPRLAVLSKQLGADATTTAWHKTRLPILSHSNQLLTQNQQRCVSQRRHAHSKRHASTAANVAEDITASSEKTVIPGSTALSCLPWSSLLRSYLITSISSVPLLLKPSLKVMSYLAHSKNKFLNPDHNRILHALIKKTFYVQFCAGETPAEVRNTISNLKTIGYKGVILGHAREVVLTKQEVEELDKAETSAEQEQLNLQEVERWRDDTLATINLTQKGDFVALKFTGSGRQALQHLKKTIPCAETLQQAVHDICKLASDRGVSLLFDAEQASLQDGIDNWTAYYMKHYNRDRAVVFGTYQSYAKRAPRILAEHAALAQKEDFVLGVKLVRGAYMGSDPRELFWDTIEGTHKCYDNLARCVMERRYSDLLQPAEGSSGEFPRAELVLASHNAESVRKAQELRDEQTRAGTPRIRMVYGQLMGMADHLSCELLQKAKARQNANDSNVDVPQAYKYLVWSPVGECMKYLLRRAQENKDAMARTIDARKALGKEIAIRLGLARARS